MNILIISSSFFPKNSPRSFRTTELVREFSRRGFKIDVYTPRIKNVHDKFENNNNGVRIYDLGKPKWSVMDLKGSRLSILFKRLHNRVANYLFDLPQSQYFFKTRRVMLSNNKKYDLLLTIAVPHSIHWGVATLWKKRKMAKKWIADCGDPFFYNVNDSFKKPFYFKYIENNFLKKCDYVTIPFVDMANYFDSKYRYKYKVIPQGMDFSDILISDSVNQSKIIKMAFSGSIIPKIRDPFRLIEELKKNYSGQFKFYIFTKQNELFKGYQDISELVIKPYMPRLELIKFLSTMDFVVNVDTKKNNSVTNAIPSKLIDYCLSKRPIYSYEQGKLNLNQLKNFMERNYDSYSPPIDINEYEITRVVDKFILLSDL